MLSLDQIAFLESLFLVDKIRKVVFFCNPNKASGPDWFFFLVLSIFLGFSFKGYYKLVNAFISINLMSLNSILLLFI
jgi:hypothetical protein